MNEMNGAALAAMPSAEALAHAGYDSETVGRARTLVETTTLSQLEIAARLGVAPTTVSLWKRRGGWVRPAEAPVQPSFARSDGGGDAVGPRRERRARKMLDRLYRAFARGIAALDGRFGRDADGLEKDARALASLARTLETLMALEGGDLRKTPRRGCCRSR